MKFLIIFTAVATILQTFRVTIFYFRKDINCQKKIFETILLIRMVVLCYFNLKEIKISIYLSIVPLLYIIVMFVYERLLSKEYISILSIKNALDMSDSGIMFLDNEEIFLINNTMKNILNDLNIYNDYINNLIRISFREINNNYIIRSLNRIWSITITNKKEIILLDITDIYNLQEEKELQNKKIEENNIKILETIQNIEKIEKTKNLLKIKNEYHDLLGHRLALFTKYLKQVKLNINDIEFLLNSITKNFYDKKNSIDKLNNLIRMYHIIGVNINLSNNLPSNEKIANVFFEIIREAATNAIIHANSKNIDIILNISHDKIEMIITNDGKKNNDIIYENEGIKGMRRKLSEIGGNLTIINDNIFTLIIVV